MNSSPFLFLLRAEDGEGVVGDREWDVVYFELVDDGGATLVGDVADVSYVADVFGVTYGFDVFDVAYVTYVLRWLGYIGHIRYIRNISYIKSIGLRPVSSLGASGGRATWLRGCLLRQGIVLRASAALGRAWRPFGR